MDFGWEGSLLHTAFSPNPGMNAVCGLYDDYYDLYAGLALAEPEGEAGAAVCPDCGSVLTEAGR